MFETLPIKEDSPYERYNLYILLFSALIKRCLICRKLCDTLKFHKILESQKFKLNYLSNNILPAA